MLPAVDGCDLRPCKWFQFGKVSRHQRDQSLLYFLDTFSTLIIKHFSKKRVFAQFIVYHIVLLLECFSMLLGHASHSHAESDFEQLTAFKFQIVEHASHDIPLGT